MVGANASWSAILVPSSFDDTIFGIRRKIPNSSILYFSSMALYLTLLNELE